MWPLKIQRAGGFFQGAGLVLGSVFSFLQEMVSWPNPNVRNFEPDLKPMEVTGKIPIYFDGL